MQQRREGSTMMADEEKGVVFGCRRWWSSTHEDFLLISQDRQLNNDQIVELMALLLARCGIGLDDIVLNN